MCLQFAQAFGNETFAPLAPADLMEFVTQNHDEGWRPFDDTPGLDPETNLPYHLGHAPVESLVALGHGSPDFCEQHHPYCGLLSSMHYWGVYHDRYGIVPVAPMQPAASERDPRVQTMLDLELVRQKRLRAALAADPQTAPLVEEEPLMHNYKLLQFFDMLALYFNMRHEGARGEADFDFVPAAVGRPRPVKVQAVEPGVYRLAPYPFDSDRLLVDCEGRYLMPLAPGGDLVAAWRAAPVVRQTFALVAG